MKDKLFFFGDYQGSRQDAPGSATASVAPEAWRRGDLSSITTPIIDPLTGQQFPGNQIPANRISPSRGPSSATRPTTRCRTRAVAGVTGNYVGETLTEIRAHQGDVRIDWNASQNDKFFGRYLLQDLQGASTTKSAFPLVLRDAQRPAVLERRLQLEPHLRVVDRQRGARRLQQHDRDGRAPSTGPASATRNATYGIAGGQPIAGLSSDRLGQRPHRRRATSRPTPTRSPRRSRSTRS